MPQNMIFPSPLTSSALFSATPAYLLLPLIPVHDGTKYVWSLHVQTGADEDDLILINKAQYDFGEYHHLMPQLRNYEGELHDHFKMSSSKIDSLLGYIKEDITRQDNNLRKPIAAEERLVIAIRYYFHMFY